MEEYLKNKQSVFESGHKNLYSDISIIVNTANDKEAL